MRMTIFQYKNASYVYFDGIETAAHRWQWALFKAILKRFKKTLKTINVDHNGHLPGRDLR